MASARRYRCYQSAHWSPAAPSRSSSTIRHMWTRWTDWCWYNRRFRFWCRTSKASRFCAWSATMCSVVRRDEWRHCVMVVYCVQSNETHLGGDHRCQQCGKQRRNDDLTRHHTAKALDQKYLYTENYGFFFLYLLYWTGYQTLRKIEIFQSIELRCAVFTVRLFYIYSYIFFFSFGAHKTRQILAMR